MVLKEAAGSEWSCSKNAHPANFFATNQRAQTKIQTDCYPYCKQGTDKLPGGKSKKDGLLIIPDFLWYFNFDKKSTPSKIGCISPISEYNKNRRCYR